MRKNQALIVSEEQEKDWAPKRNRGGADNTA